MSEEWAGILAPDEKILWQGAPDVRVRFEWRSPLEPFFFLFFTGFSLFWMIGASQSGGFFWAFGLLHFSMGAYFLVGTHFWKAYQRKHKFYTLTDRRAMIGTKMFGRRNLDSFQITSQTEIALRQGKDTSDIYFAKQDARGLDGRKSSKDVGFEQIDDALTVFSLMQEIQHGRKH